MLTRISIVCLWQKSQRSFSRSHAICVPLPAAAITQLLKNPEEVGEAERKLLLSQTLWLEVHLLFAHVCWSEVHRETKDLKVCG